MTIIAATRKIAPLVRAARRRWTARAWTTRTPLPAKLALAGVLAAVVILGVRLIVPTPPAPGFAPGLAGIAAYDLEGVRAGGPVDAVFVDNVGTGLRDIAEWDKAYLNDTANLSAEKILRGDSRNFCRKILTK